MADKNGAKRWAILGVAAAVAIAVGLAVALWPRAGDGGTGEDARTADVKAEPGAEGTPGGQPEAGDSAGAPKGTGHSGLTPTLAADQCGAPSGATVDRARVPRGHCAWIFAADLDAPRGMVVDDGGHVLVVERGREQVTALVDADGSRTATGDERHVVARAPGLNHGLWIHDGSLYASSATTVYRWPYAAGETSSLGEPEVIVRGMPTGGHTTRTPVARPGDRWLYVSIGSAGNVDRDASRARVMRYDLTAIPDDGYRWTDGELYADGLRNEVGLAFDGDGRLWGVQNGSDNLERENLGGDIHVDNPAEELNRLTEPGRFHGYPYCWTEYALPPAVGRGRGTQWAHPQFLGDGVHDDAWCRDRENVEPPALSMQAHTAPLDLLFWPGGGGLPDGYRGDAIVGMHGSWNRPVPVGYKVVRVAFEGGTPRGVAPVLEYAGEGDTGDGWPHRPVAVSIGPRGALLVTSDASGVVLAVDRPR